MTTDTENLALKCTLPRRLTNWLQGKHTAFVIFFALSGFVLAWFGKLTGPYVGLCSVLQGAVLAHSVKEDHFKSDRSDNGDPQ